MRKFGVKGQACKDPKNVLKEAKFANGGITLACLAVIDEVQTDVRPLKD